MTFNKEAFLNSLRTHWYKPDLVHYVPDVLPPRALAGLADKIYRDELLVVDGIGFNATIRHCPFIRP